MSGRSAEELERVLDECLATMEAINARPLVFEIPFGTGNVGIGEIVGDPVGVGLFWVADAKEPGTVIPGTQTVPEGSVLLTFKNRAGYDALMKVLRRIGKRLPK